MTAKVPYAIVVTTGGGADARVHATLESIVGQPGDVRAAVVGPAPTGLPPGVEVCVGVDPWAVATDIAGADGMSAVIEAGDTLRPGVLAEISSLLARDGDVDVVYTDERVHGGGGHEDWLKPAWSPERARWQDYLGQLTMVRSRALGGLTAGRPRVGQSPHHAVVVAAAARARRVEHLPVIGADRHGSVGEPSSRPRRPLTRSVSVVIPTAGVSRAVWGVARPLVLAAIDSVLAVTKPRPEVVVVVDPTTPPDVRGALERRDVVLVDGRAPFNYAAACNQGVRASGGELVVLLNDDVLVEDAGWVAAMADYLSDPDVGVVGARLLYADGTLQHGGVLLNEQALHIFRGYAGEDPGPFDLLRVSREVSAVTGACLMTPRRLWDELDGLDESFVIAGNDLDYCLRAWARGLRSIWAADATLYHFESQSRRENTAPEDMQRLFARWSDRFHHDPYGHPEFEPRQAEWVPRQPLGVDQVLWRAVRAGARRVRPGGGRATD